MKKILALFSLVILSCNQWEKKYQKEILLTEFWGTIDSIYLDPDSRMQPVVIINEQKYSIDNEIYTRFEKGDTLYKPLGTMKYYWIKNRDTVLFFQKYGKYDLTDSGKVWNPYQ